MPTRLEKIIGDAARSDYPEYVDTETVVAHMVMQWFQKEYNESDGDFDFVMWSAKQEFSADDE